MGDVLAYIVLAALMVLLVLAAVSLLRSFLLAIRSGKGAVPPTRIVSVLPPEPVTLTGGVKLTSTAALLWCAAHLVVVALWAITGHVAPRIFSTGLVALYIGTAAGLTGAGGMLLRTARATGRRVVAWGQFLLGVASVLAIALSLMLPRYEDAPAALREYSIFLGALFLTHLIIDIVIGSAAQHVGKSSAAMDDTDNTEPPTGS
ncbi:MAG: hypothetical protein ACOC9S_01645 [Planctomycetota bacterium]